jgi:hypothetical protein
VVIVLAAAFLDRSKSSPGRLCEAFGALIDDASLFLIDGRLSSHSG